MSGRLIPFSPRSLSPWGRAAVISTVTARCGPRSRTTPPMRPSSSQTRSPGRTRVNTCGSVQPIVAGAITRPSVVGDGVLPGLEAAREPEQVAPAQQEIALRRENAADPAAARRAFPAASVPVQLQDRLGRDVGGLHRLGPAAGVRRSPVMRRHRNASRASVKSSPSPGRSPASHRASTAIEPSASPSGCCSRPGGCSQIRAGAVTLPKRSRRGRHLRTGTSGSTGPVRSFGPPRSIRTRQRRPDSRRARRRCSIMRPQTSGWSWAQLIRMQSMPCSSRSRISRGSSAASLGIVTITRTRRPPGGGPNSASVWVSSSLRPCLKERPSSASGAGGAPRRSSTAESEARTCDSARPSDESPSAASRSCSRRRSWRRSAR